jgi:regulator of sirC expression with transglutaminase-like and TPR domain
MAFSNSNAVAVSFKEVLGKYSLQQIPLDVAALAIAGPLAPGVDVMACLCQLDGIAAEVRSMAGPDPSSETLLDTLRHVLFERHGFRGNHEDYYNPDNSYLNKVLETRMGIPITLSLVMIEVGRRLSLPLVGIGLPCHFMAGFLSPSGTRYFDAFHGGVEHTREECVEMVRTLSGGSVEAGPEHFEPVSNQMFLTRMLCNLRGIHRQRGDHAHLATVLRKLLLLNPNNLNLHLELASVSAECGDLSGALEQMAVYKQITGKTGDAPSLQLISKEIRKRMAVFN